MREEEETLRLRHEAWLNGLHQPLLQGRGRAHENWSNRRAQGTGGLPGERKEPMNCRGAREGKRPLLREQPSSLLFQGVGRREDGSAVGGP